jgi:hypothetical protein
MQHIRNYHHHEIDTKSGAALSTSSCLKYNFPVCSHPDCPKYRGPEFEQMPRTARENGKPFATQSEYTKHMREEHDECSFPCDILGCSRIGRRGYFREKDLIKHRKEQHPDAPNYQANKREVRHRCTELGCGKLLDPSSLQQHYWFVHK